MTPRGVGRGKRQYEEFKNPAHDPEGGRTGCYGNKKIPFLYCKVPQVEGAGSQGTEPRSMIWDGTLTDSIRKRYVRMNSAPCRCSHGGAGRRLGKNITFEYKKTV